LAASSVYGIPWWRHFIAWIGAVPATSGNFKKMLKKGHSVAVIVGGIAGETAHDVSENGLPT
jgi:2-acylglycerol O-acyltransferase 2